MNRPDRGLLTRAQADAITPANRRKTARDIGVDLDAFERVTDALTGLALMVLRHGPKAVDSAIAAGRKGGGGP